MMTQGHATRQSNGSITSPSKTGSPWSRQAGMDDVVAELKRKQSQSEEPVERLVLSLRVRWNVCVYSLLKCERKVSFTSLLVWMYMPL